jgi:predicted TIM-barrel fold metal-dependent hydrolase
MHVFGGSDRYPFAERRSYTPRKAPIERYLTKSRFLGFRRVVLIQPSVYEYDNRCMLDTMARLGDNCRGVAVVSPSVPVWEL